MQRRGWRGRGLGILGAWLILLAPVAAQARMMNGQHAVLGVVNRDRVRIEYNGLPISVRLAHVKPGADLTAAVEGVIGRQKVQIMFDDDLGADEDGLPYVYLFVGQTNLNVELVKQGAADYDTTRGKSKSFDGLLAKALAEARQARRGLWGGASGATTVAVRPPPPTPVTPVTSTGGAAPKATGVVISEMRAKYYHRPDCIYCSKISVLNRIQYADAAAAERAGKKPCLTCFGGYEAAATTTIAAPATTTTTTAAPPPAAETKSEFRFPAAKVGKLIGLKSDKRFFYAPGAQALEGVALSDMVGFQTVQEAQASGRQPDWTSLRIGTPPGAPREAVPKDECIGRAPPWFRPCRRPPADASGLCSYCQGRE